MDSRREFSADEYRQYEKLMHKVARRHYGILINSGYTDEYMDVFQNVAVSFLQAKNGYRADTGFKFTTYACTSAEKNFITQLEKRSRRLSPVSLESIRSKDDDVSFWEEIIADENTLEYRPSPRVCLIEAIGKMNLLSSVAKLVVRELVSPSEEIRKAYREGLSYAKKAKELGGHIPRIGDDIDYAFIFRYYGIKVKDRKKVFAEIRKVFEV